MHLYASIIYFHMLYLTYSAALNGAYCSTIQLLDTASSMVFKLKSRLGLLLGTAFGGERSKVLDFSAYNGWCW